MSTAIHPAAFVDERARLGTGVEIGPGATIDANVTIGDRTRIGSHALITGWTTVGHDVTVHHGAVLGSPPQDLKYAGEKTFLEVGDHTVIREYATANIGTHGGGTTRVGSHCLIMAYAHVAHDCQIGDRVILANGTQLAGFVTIEDWAIIGGLVAIHQFVRVGCHAMIGGCSRVTQDIVPYVRAAGVPPRLGGTNGVGLKRRGFSAETCRAIDRAYRTLFRKQLTIEQAVAAMRSETPGIPEVEHMARFAETSVRGITR